MSDYNFWVWSACYFVVMWAARPLPLKRFWIILIIMLALSWRLP